MVLGLDEPLFDLSSAASMRAAARRFACATETSLQKPHSGSAPFGLFGPFSSGATTTVRASPRFAVDVSVPDVSFESDLTMSNMRRAG